VLWDNLAVSGGRDRGEWWLIRLSPAALQTEFALSTRFPALAESPGFSRTNNYTTILELWSNVTGQESASDRLYALLDEGAEAEAISRVVADRGAASPKYFFLEGQINFAGYRFLQEGKVPQAVALLSLNRDFFPESWNVYDSLAEALLAAGETDAAMASYEKSLELAPQNTNAVDALARIRTGATAP